MPKRKPKPRNQNIAKYMSRYDEANKGRGIVRVSVRIPETKREPLLELCAQWRKEVGAK